MNIAKHSIIILDLVSSREIVSLDLVIYNMT